MPLTDDQKDKIISVLSYELSDLEFELDKERDYILFLEKQLDELRLELKELKWMREGLEE